MSIKRMQRAGLVEKAADESDMRYNRIKITERGQQISEKCREEFERIDRRMFEGFSEQEIKQLYSFLNRMSNNLEADKISRKDVVELFKQEK
jgi:DNA-binding MarR family transcriptional regulator